MADGVGGGSADEGSIFRRLLTLLGRFWRQTTTKSLREAECDVSAEVEEYDYPAASRR